MTVNWGNMHIFFLILEIENLDTYTLIYGSWPETKWKMEKSLDQYCFVIFCCCWKVTIRDNDKTKYTLAIPFKEIWKIYSTCFLLQYCFAISVYSYLLSWNPQEHSTHEDQTSLPQLLELNLSSASHRRPVGFVQLFVTVVRLLLPHHTHRCSLHVGRYCSLVYLCSCRLS